MTQKKVQGKKKSPGKSPMAANEEKVLYQLASAMAVRATIASRLGKSFSDDRDLYVALGYKKEPTLNDYLAKYYRQDIARRIIDAPVRACWRKPPRITESKDEETKFETAWASLVKTKRIYHYLSRVDRLASIGSFAVLLLGFDDGNGMASEVKSAKQLLYLMPYGQNGVKISTYETDSKNPRYGLPREYSITQKAIGQTVSASSVHHSRVIHVAEDLLEDNVEGIPKLRAVLNRLDDLERISGGSAEMFWRGAFPGFGLKLDPNATIGPQGLKDLQDEIENYIHGLKRYMRLTGISVEALAQQVADPSKNVDVQIDLIACAVNMPKRILMGSERGELASSQDERAWLATVDERRRQHCEPVILRPLIDRLITVGALPEPAEEYAVDWPEVMAPSEKEKAQVGEAKSRSLKNYVESIGADAVVPPEMFLRKILGMTDEEIAEIEAIQEQLGEEEEEE